ncbi:MAG: toprim domain-containing protein [Kiloniellaceae bacterium]
MSEPNRFTEFFLAEVRARTAIAGLIGADVALKRKGAVHWGLCPFHQEKTPSFTVREDRGRYRCFGCGAAGDVIDYLRQAHGMSFRDAVQRLAVEAGLARDAAGRQRRRRPAIKRVSESEALREREAKVAWSRDLWRGCVPIAGTPAETYLRRRGLTLTLPPTLRFHPGLKHRETGLVFPAMVAAVQDGEGRITGVHRTFLLPDGSGKARVASPKQMGGACWGGCVRLGPAEAEMRLGEGIETALSVQQETGRTCWAGLSLGGMGAAVLPRLVTGVTILGENGNKDPEAYRAILAGVVRCHQVFGRAVRVAMPDARWGDFNDPLRDAAQRAESGGGDYAARPEGGAA